MGRFGLIGRVLGHSFSPVIHGMIGGYEYELYPTEPEDLDEFLRTTDCDGFNVTIPYKLDVMRSCAELTPRARAIGCVNTMTRTADGGWRGDNTDWDGFLYLLGDDAESFHGCPALVLGSGGASRTVRAVLNHFGIPYTVISRSGPDNYTNLERHADAELIVNATPVGMYPDNGSSPLDLRPFPKCRLILDVVYNPARTALVLQADELGIPARSGLSMLVAQGVRASERFTGQELPKGTIERITSAISLRTSNVVLIGMPGCGKTTTAIALAEITGRPCYDVDTLIVEREGCPIPEIFARGGDPEFRRIETAVLADISRHTGAVIATGGGVVTRPENRNLIRQNSICVFLDREDFDRLPTDGRPVSQAVGVSKLKEQRMPLYRAWGDYTVSADSAMHAAQKIKELLGL